MGDLSEFYDVESSEDEVVNDSLTSRSVYVAPSSSSNRRDRAPQQYTRGRSRGPSSKHQAEPPPMNNSTARKQRKSDRLSTTSGRELQSLSKGSLEGYSQQLRSVQGDRLRRPSFEEPEQARSPQGLTPVTIPWSKRKRLLDTAGAARARVAHFKESKRARDVEAYAQGHLRRSQRLGLVLPARLNPASAGGLGRRPRSAARYLTDEDLRRSWDATIQSRFHFWLRARWFSKRQLLRWRPGARALRELEGQCGSAAALTFAFVRWVGEVNAALACLAFLVLVLPFFLQPPPGYSARAFVGGSLGALLQGSGLEETWVLYGGYRYSREDLDGRGSYKFDLAFSVFVCALFAASLALLLLKIASRYSGSGDCAFVGTARLYPFASVVFASSDFHITSPEAVRSLCRGIRAKLKEMLGDRSLEAIELSRTQQVVQKLRRVTGLFVLWPLVIAFTGYVVLTLVQELDFVNNTIGKGFGYTQSVFLVLCNLVGKQLVYLLVAFEQWPPNMVMPILAAKLFCLRVISDIMLVYELYNKYGRLEGSAGRQDDTCMENDIGIVLLRVAVGNIFLSQCGNALFHWVEFKRGVMYDFEAAEMVIDTISNQSIVWIGSMVSPVVPLIGCLGNALTFTLTKWWLIRTCKPVRMSFSANRTSNLPYGMLLSTLALSTIPATYWLGQDRSRSCGPIPGTSMMKTMMDYLADGPLALRIFLSWVANPLFMILVLAFLVLWLIVTRAKLVHRHKEEDILREELNTARQEIAQRASKKQCPRIFEDTHHAGG